MSTSSAVRLITVRKPRTCEWCGEVIPRGSECCAWTYFERGEPPYRMRMHPECDDAARGRVGYGYIEEWTPYSQPRGCNCGWDKDCERCAARLDDLVARLQPDEAR